MPQKKKKSATYLLVGLVPCYPVCHLLPAFVHRGLPYKYNTLEGFPVVGNGVSINVSLLCFTPKWVKWTRKLGCWSDARPELSGRPRPFDLT